MKKVTRFLTAFLIVALCLSPAMASGDNSTSNANKLYALHLFRGTGVRDDGTPIYSLERTPTRLQGLIMMIRFFGEESAALAGDGQSPFTDVSGEGGLYVAYAYRRGVTNGTSESTFTPGAALSARAYLAFLLRAMGYTESGGDYTWETIMTFAESLGILTESEAAALDAGGLDRGGMVDLSCAALNCRVKGSARTLAEVLMEKGVFTEEEWRNASAATPAATSTLSGLPWESLTPSDSPVTRSEPSPAQSDNSPAQSDNSETSRYEKKSVKTSEGFVTAHIITVNTLNPKVRVRTAMVDNRLGHTASFTKIVQNSGGAVAVINGNFFNSYSKFQTPIGHVMSFGEFLYGNSGISSIGFTSGGEIRVGRPSVFTRLKSGSDEWSAYEINTPEQDDSASVLYTPAYGEQVVMTNGGWALTVNQGVITEFYSVSAGAAIAIPPEGYVVYMGGGYSSTPYFKIPQKGSEISMEYYLRVADDEGFALDDVQSVVSGAPRLVQDGQMVTELEAGFTESRFTTASSPRTAIGVNASGELLLMSVPAGATIQQMRELALALDCQDAINLDGGASSAMYYKGNYLTVPSRELTVTLQIFVDD